MGRTNDVPDGPSPEIAPEDAERLRGVFQEAGYTAAAIGERLGFTGSKQRPIYGTLLRHELPRHLAKLRGGDPLATLIRAFYLGVAVGREAFRAAIRPTEPGLWESAGLAREVDGQVRGVVQITPFEGLLLAIDTMWDLAADDVDRVMSVSGTTTALASLTVRPRRGRALDLGTGCGVHALLAARHCDEVVGVDLNARAIRRAAFNARLNGLAHTRWAVGDLFGPVEGERFDLIVANPPFVVSPDKERTYRDSGRHLDGLCEEIARRIPGFLNPGGYAQILCNWVHVRGQDWRDRLAGWVAGSGCDAWVVHFEAHDPVDYATTWIAPLADPTPEARSHRFDAWSRYYEEAGVEAISYGLITLRRAPGRPNWFKCEDAPPWSGACGDAILGRFARRDFLDSVRDDAALLAARLRASPDLVWDQTLRASGGAGRCRGRD